jgi:hypothetical protein
MVNEAGEVVADAGVVFDYGNADAHLWVGHKLQELSGLGTRQNW